jgi:hypothetical protein
MKAVFKRKKTSQLTCPDDVFISSKDVLKIDRKIFDSNGLPIHVSYADKIAGTIAWALNPELIKLKQTEMVTLMNDKHSSTISIQDVFNNMSSFSMGFDFISIESSDKIPVLFESK